MGLQPVVQLPHVESHMFHRDDIMFEKNNIHSRRPQWPNWIIEQFLEIGHVIMYIVSSCSWTRFPLVMKSCSGFVSTLNWYTGLDSLRYVASWLQTTDNYQPLCCDLAIWNMKYGNVRKRCRHQISSRELCGQHLVLTRRVRKIVCIPKCVGTHKNSIHRQNNKCSNTGFGILHFRSSREMFL